MSFCGASPVRTDTRISWFGAPEQGLRGMNGGGRPMGFGSSGYAYAPSGRVERLEGVRIPIWSTKAFTARWFAPIGGEKPNGSTLLSEATKGTPRPDQR